MDGVLADFENRFVSLYGKEALNERDRKNFTKNWPNFVMTNQFEILDLFPGAIKLVTFLESYNVKIEILSSSGGEKFHEEVKRQKIAWLKNNHFDFKPNIVPGRKYKNEYAGPGKILIDDTPDVVDSFKSAGGFSILHTNVDDTIDILFLLLDNTTSIVAH